MNLSSIFEVNAIGENVILKLTRIKADTKSLIVIPEQVSEKSEFACYEVMHIGPRLKGDEWGLSVGLLVMVEGQIGKHPMFPEYFIVHPAQILIALKKKESPDGQAETT